MQSVYRARLMDGSLAAAGSGLVILLGILVRARRPAAGRASGSQLQPAKRIPLVVEIDRPPCDPILASVGFDLQDERTARSQKRSESTPSL